MTIKDLIRKIAEVAGKKDPAATAVACRGAIRDGVGAIYKSKGTELPPKASLLELLADTSVREFIADDDCLRDLEFVRVLGMNAEHRRKVKRAHAQLAAETCTSFLEAVDAKLEGRVAPGRPCGITEAETVKVEGNTVTYRTADGEHTVTGDSVVICGGMTPLTAEAFGYSGLTTEFYAIGDCNGAGNLEVCNREAYSRAMIL